MDDFSNEIVGSLLDDFISFQDNDASAIPVSFEDFGNYLYNRDSPSAAGQVVSDVLEYSGRDLNVLGNNVAVNSNDGANEQREHVQLTGVTLQIEDDRPAVGSDTATIGNTLFAYADDAIQAGSGEMAGQIHQVSSGNQFVEPFGESQLSAENVTNSLAAKPKKKREPRKKKKDSDEKHLNVRHDGCSSVSQPSSQDSYICPFCSKSYLHAANLKQHMSIHTGKGFFQCSKCPRRFPWKNVFHRHLTDHAIAEARTNYHHNTANEAGSSAAAQVDFNFSENSSHDPNDLNNNVELILKDSENKNMKQIELIELMRQVENDTPAPDEEIDAIANSVLDYEDGGITTHLPTGSGETAPIHQMDPGNQIIEPIAESQLNAEDVTNLLDTIPKKKRRQTVDDSDDEVFAYTQHNTTNETYVSAVGQVDFGVLEDSRRDPNELAVNVERNSEDSENENREQVPLAELIRQVENDTPAPADDIDAIVNSVLDHADDGITTYLPTGSGETTAQIHQMDPITESQLNAEDVTNSLDPIPKKKRRQTVEDSDEVLAYAHDNTANETYVSAVGQLDFGVLEDINRDQNELAVNVEPNSADENREQIPLAELMRQVENDTPAPADEIDAIVNSFLDHSDGGITTHLPADSGETTEQIHQMDPGNQFVESFGESQLIAEDVTNSLDPIPKKKRRQTVEDSDDEVFAYTHHNTTNESDSSVAGQIGFDVFENTNHELNEVGINVEVNSNSKNETVEQIQMTGQIEDDTPATADETANSTTKANNPVDYAAKVTIFLPPGSWIDMGSTFEQINEEFPSDRSREEFVQSSGALEVIPENATILLDTPPNENENGENHIDDESQCFVCKMKLADQFELIRHLRAHVDSKICGTTSTKTLYKCDECGKILKSVYYFLNHWKAHIEGTLQTIFTCTVCNIKFSKKFTLEKHLRTHSETGAYQCSRCKVRFVWSRSLTLHTKKCISSESTSIRSSPTSK